MFVHSLIRSLAALAVIPWVCAQTPYIGNPPVAPDRFPAQVATSLGELSNATSIASPSWIDTSSRATVQASYNSVFVPTKSVAMGWVGDVGSGNAGDTSATYKSAVTERINWLRSLAGVPGGVALGTTFNQGDQQAAMMMSANGQLSHSPPNTWKFYSAAGATAANNSNICLGFAANDPGCLELYMLDSGGNNTAGGHRRWILYPESTTMGTGDVPYTLGYTSANALWVIDTSTYGLPRPATRDNFVAWPPKGYVPYQFVYPRWSFSYPGADFSAATVSMQRGGGSVPVKLEAVQNGYGENTIVWITDNQDPSAFFSPTPPVVDTPVTVTIQNAMVNGSAQSFTYQVIIFDPATAGTSAASKPGVFRQGFLWVLDVNGNHSIDQNGSDAIFGFGGLPGDIPIYGDWNGDGHTKTGFVRNGNRFFLDYNGNHQYDGPSVDRVYTFGGLPGDIPVVGDWNGDGKGKIGVYRKGVWILDVNGDGIENDGPAFGFGGFPGDVPVVGDWTGSGKSNAGVFRQGFLWVLDTNGNHTNGAVFPYGGFPGDVPVVGDWSGTGVTRVGILRQGFLWVLDANGNHAMDDGPGFIFAFGGFPGPPADVPVVGKW